ncbi:MAG: rhomboid family intramembrane serine protease [Candidatus Bathyarchaeia archaeon]
MFPIGDENRPSSTPFVNYSLIALNVIVFLYESSMSEYGLNRFIYQYGFVSARIQILTVFTSMFIHADILHLLSNMLYLYIFGDNVEDSMGHFVYLLFYVTSGIGASFFHYVSDPVSMIPAIGASGAISGVLGAYFMRYPWARIRTIVTGIVFWRIARVPALIFIGFWFVLQLFYVTMTDYSGIAYWAHIGGFVVGFLASIFFPKRRRPPKIYWQVC